MKPEFYFFTAIVYTAPHISPPLAAACACFFVLIGVLKLILDAMD